MVVIAVPIIRGDAVRYCSRFRAVDCHVRCLVSVRVFLTLLMLAQAMACPFLHCGECQGACAFNSADSAQDDRGCCETESHPAEHLDAPREHPEKPQCPDHGKCVDCLCGGAIRAEHVKCPDLIPGAICLVLPDGFSSELRLACAADSACLACSGPVHFPSLISGRHVCVLTQTYRL